MTDNSTQSLLEIRDLQINFGPVTAVKKVNLTIEAGKIVGLVGESGSGKSTLAMAILGLLPDIAEIPPGSIKFDGTELIGQSENALRKIRGSEISLISQDPMSALNPVLTIGQQMVEIQYRSDDAADDKWKHALYALNQVKLPNPEERMKMYPHQLSGGQKQRIAIAMAILSKPKLLIADEPTTALDATLEVKIIDLLKELQKEIGCSMIFVTHHLGVISSLCDEVVVMYHGDIREVGTVTEVFGNPQDDYTKRLLSCDPARIHEKCRRLPTMANPEITQEMLSENQIRNIDHSKTPVLSISDLDVTFKKPFSILNLFKDKNDRTFKAVKQASINVWQGETVALIGESGSGKTTIAKTVMQLVEAENGTIKLGDQLIDRNNCDPLYKNVAMMFQDPIGSLSPRMSIGSLITEPYKVHNVSLSNRDEKARELLNMVGLNPDFVDRFPHELSGGQARRVGVARALALSPKIIVADEPTAGLDVSVQGEILNLFAELQEKLGLSIFIITHNLNVVRHISDRMVIMYMGEIIEQGQTDEIFNHPKEDYTKKLLAAHIHPDF